MEVGEWNDTVHQPDLQGPSGRQLLGEQGELQRPSCPHGSWQQERRSGVRDQPDPDERHAERGFLARQAEVTGQGHGHPRPGHDAVDGGDHRFRRLGE